MSKPSTSAVAEPTSANNSSNSTGSSSSGGTHPTTPAAPLQSFRSALSKGPANPGYFFFAANRRSGTTWLTSMLATHREVMIKNEGWLFNGGPGSIEHWLNDDAFNAFLELPSAKGQWLREIPESDARLLLVRAMAEAVMLEAAARAPWKDLNKLRMIGDKTTTHLCAKAEFVHQLFPDAHYLHMVRDGRDVVVSDMFLKFSYEAFDEFDAAHRDDARAAYRFHALGEGEPVPLFTAGTITPFINTWKASIAGGHRAKELYPADRFCEVRYETLLNEPSSELARIFRFLGVDASDDIVAHCVAQNTFEKHSGGRKPGEASALNPTRKGVAGDWKNHFTDNDKALFKDLAGELLIELGYEQSLDW